MSLVQVGGQRGGIPPEFQERLEVLKRLGSGGGSSVYLVQDREDPSRLAALKVLDIHAVDGDTVERFEQEFEVLRSLKHPNLIEGFEFIHSDGSVAYTMEYVEGKNLLEVLRMKRLSAEEVDVIFSQILGALNELHVHGLAHRDIKLENILMRNDGLVKLSDLGLMKDFDQCKTEAGVLLGTSQYLPPEYVKHSVYDSRSDIYAIGLMLFECLTGKRWLEGKQGPEALRYLCEINFEFPKLALSGLPFKYQRILDCALNVHPWKRYETAEHMRRALLSETGDPEPTQIIQVNQHLDIRTVGALRNSVRQSKRARIRKFWMGLGGVVGAAAVTVAIGMANFDFSSPPPTSRLPEIEIEKPQIPVAKKADKKATNKKTGKDARTKK